MTRPANLEDLKARTRIRQEMGNITADVFDNIQEASIGRSVGIQINKDASASLNRIG